MVFLGYAHLSKAYVPDKGSKYVDKGQVVGLSGELNITSFIIPNMSNNDNTISKTGIWLFEKSW